MAPARLRSLGVPGAVRRGGRTLPVVAAPGDAGRPARPPPRQPRRRHPDPPGRRRGRRFLRDGLLRLAGRQPQLFRPAAGRHRQGPRPLHAGGGDRRRLHRRLQPARHDREHLHRRPPARSAELPRRRLRRDPPRCARCGTSRVASASPCRSICAGETAHGSACRTRGSSSSTSQLGCQRIRAAPAAPASRTFFPAWRTGKTGPWLAHRLDRDTAGCLVIARKKAALLAAQAAFAAAAAS